METANAQLQLLKEHFPSQYKQIEFLYLNDAAFRGICSDYILCLQYSRKISSEMDEKKLSLEEYDQVKSDLESELLEYLRKR